MKFRIELEEAVSIMEENVQEIDETEDILLEKHVEGFYMRIYMHL